MTHTYALLEISQSAYDEIRQKLGDAGYQHAFDGKIVDMHGIAVVPSEKSDDVQPIDWRLRLAMNAACTCMTKTHEPQYHDTACRYRVLEDARREIKRLENLLLYRDDT